MELEDAKLMARNVSLKTLLVFVIPTIISATLAWGATQSRLAKVEDDGRKSSTDSEQRYRDRNADMVRFRNTLSRIDRNEARLADKVGAPYESPRDDE